MVALSCLRVKLGCLTTAGGGPREAALVVYFGGGAGPLLPNVGRDETTSDNTLAAEADYGPGGRAVADLAADLHRGPAVRAGVEVEHLDGEFGEVAADRAGVGVGHP